jgi:hypothetical protein
MTAPHVTLGGLSVARASLSIPARGAWFVRSITLVDGPTTTPAGVLKIGAAEWRGTIVNSGLFGDQWQGELAAGAGKWGTPIPRRGYHNDANVSAELVIRDAAREAGETLGTVAPAAANLGINYARKAGSASEALIDAAGGAPVWVDRAGVTHVGPRPVSSLHGVDVLEYDVHTGRLVFVLDDLTTIDVGTTITDPRLTAPFLVTALDVDITPDRITCTAWSDVAADPLLDVVAALVRQVIATQGLHGVYEYRVVTMHGMRADLQAIDAAAGLPDLKLIDQWPGVAGANATLALGKSVLVAFVNGDRARPVVTGYVGGDLGVPTLLTFGGPGAAPAVRQGDPVQCPLPPAVFSGTIGGAPASGVLTFPLVTLTGNNTGGSAKVRIA